MPVTDPESLVHSHDIISIGMLADDLRRRRHGTRTTFVRVANVAADVGAPVSRPAAAGEVRIVGVPGSRAAAVERVTLRALLEKLRAAGLELVAEAPVDRLQDARRSIEEVNIAGMALARLTVDQSSSADPMPLLKAVADLQRRVAVLRAFAPLPRRLNAAAPTTGYEDVKHVALARLVVDNVPSIQVDWSLYGPKLAQVALTVGADDVDAVSAEDETTDGRRRAPLQEIRRNIIAAGQEPVERNGRFDILRPLDTLGVFASPSEERRAQDERSR